MGGGGTRLARAASTFLVTVGVSIAALGGAAVARDGTVAESYRELARQVAPVSDARGARDGAGAPGVDWGALLSQNAGVCGWLRVEGTTVDVPVLSTTERDPDAWLYTDLWGQPSETGTPYLDHRCDPEGRAMVVYGHRTAYESYLFHDVSPLFEQEALDAVGDASWETPSSSAVAFRPLCAASVDMADARWQRFSFEDAVGLRDWLSWACGEADAVRPGAEGLVEGAERALVLVTCNGPAFYPDTRTVAVFVAGGGA